MQSKGASIMVFSLRLVWCPYECNSLSNTLHQSVLAVYLHFSGFSGFEAALLCCSILKGFGNAGDLNSGHGTGSEFKPSGGQRHAQTSLIPNAEAFEPQRFSLQALWLSTRLDLDRHCVPDYSTVL